TAIVAAPVGISMAHALGASPDPFLMAVAVASSCAFLTPIGHKNNMLILGPGGYRFGDYWPMGLPLEVLVIATGLPAILFFWPLWPDLERPESRGRRAGGERREEAQRNADVQVVRAPVAPRPLDRHGGLVADGRREGCRGREHDGDA